MPHIHDLERREGRSFKEILNELLVRGLGLASDGQEAAAWTCPSRDLGQPRLDVEKALRLADLLEADAVAEKWELGK